jgi:hypothetical protein
MKMITLTSLPLNFRQPKYYAFVGFRVIFPFFISPPFDNLFVARPITAK